MGKASQRKIDLVFKRKRDDDKIIKTRLRNTMEDGFLTNNLLVNIEGDILEKYSYEDIIEDFKCVKERKADL